ncbi:MAG: hypothetical protein HUU13_03445 [Burkholderiaceae bacterium]|nr:hypothetical protein [Burkholderiaceae bacterium]
MKTKKVFIKIATVLLAALGLTPLAYAQSPIAKDHFLAGFMHGCEHSEEFLTFEQKICRNSPNDHLQAKNCKKGEIILSQNIKALADFKFHKDYYEYVLKFEPGTMMFGPLDVSILTFYVGNSNGISASELRFRDVKTAKEATGLLQKNSLKIRKSINEMGDEVIPKLHQTKTPPGATLSCDLSN